MSKLNVLVCGSTGYIGIELVKILARHKKINIKYLCGNSSVGKSISFYDKSLSKKKLPIIRKFQRKLLKEVDIIFSALPNGEAQKLSKFLLDKNLQSSAVRLVLPAPTGPPIPTFNGPFLFFMFYKFLFSNFHA